MARTISRGELYYVYLDPAFGHELGGYKTRPVVVVSADDLNRRPGVVAVVPGTSTASGFWNVVRVDPDTGNGLRDPTYFQCHQVRAIDQGRMTSRSVGRLSKADLKRVEKTVWECLGLIP